MPDPSGGGRRPRTTPLLFATERFHPRRAIAFSGASLAFLRVGAYGRSDLSGMLSLPAATRSDVEIPPEGIFLVMELVEGCSLRTWIGGEHGWRVRLEVMLQAGRGVAAAHAHGLVHRDFKPDNVQVGSPAPGTSDETAHRVRVLDFGLARASNSGAISSPWPPVSGDDVEVGVGSLDSPLTRSGIVAGTPAYMSPERQTGVEADPRSDQYNYCVTLYEVLAGHRPFPRGSLESLLRAKSQGEILDPPRESQRRFASMEALLRELERRPGAWLRWAVPLTVLCAVPVTLWLGRSRPEDLCEAAADGVERSWSSSIEDNLHARIDRVLGPRAEEIWPKARDRLGAYAQAWKGPTASSW